MTTEVDKITNAPTQNELIDKVNEVIDNLGGGGITVDTALSTTSENPVQNKVITDALDGKSNISNTVTTDTAQNITGFKTFVGGNKLRLKQDTATSRPGFIITDSNAKEVGSLQYRPNAIGTNAMLNLNSPGSTYLGFRYWGDSSNTYNLLMPLPSNANTKFAAGDYYFPLGFTDGTNTVLTSNSGMVDISTFLSDFVSTRSLATTLTDYVKFTDLSTVATTGDYNDLDNLPTFKTINNNSILGSGNITVEDIFWAEYGVTSYNDIKDALDANKIVVCNVTESTSGIPFVYTYHASRIGKDTTYIQNNSIIFNCMTGVVNKTLVCDTSSNWTSYNYKFAQESNVPTESTVSGWGFTKNTGTVTSVNNVQPINGNVTLSIPEQVQANWNETDTTSKAYIQNKPTIPTVDQSFNGTSTNAESGVSILSLLQTIYPVGSVYLSTNSTCPLASLFGTWELVSSGRALWTGTGSNGGSTINAGLPNIVGFLVRPEFKTKDNTSGSFYNEGSENGRFQGNGSGTWYARGTNFDASRSSSIYGNSTTVQPPAYVVNVWRRTA